MGVTHDFCACFMSGKFAAPICIFTNEYSMCSPVSLMNEVSHLTLTVWLQQTLDVYLIAIDRLHHANVTAYIQNPTELYVYHIILRGKFFPIGEASNPGPE